MKIEKDKNGISVLQITEASLKFLGCSFSDNQKKRSMAVEIEPLSENAPDGVISGALNRLFKKAGYTKSRLIISLPRNKATVRYLKVPSQAPEEIEKIIALQASRLVPYPLEELITGYQIIGTDQNGYTELNVIIVHKDILERYFSLFKGIPSVRLNIALNSYGLSSLYTRLKPADSRTVMLMDLDGNQMELVIIGNKRMFFSRSIKIEREGAEWEKGIFEEIKRTLDAYGDETGGKKPEGIIVLGAGSNNAELVKYLNEKSGFPAEILPYEKEVNLSPEGLRTTPALQSSVAGLAGFALEPIPLSLNLLPRAIKEKTRKGAQAKERLQLVIFTCAAFLLIGAGLVRNLDNKARYLGMIQQELKKIEKDAAYLADMENRMRAFEKRLHGRPSVLEMVYQLFQVTPSVISITQFSFAEEEGVVIRGQCKELNSVLELVSLLGKSPAYSKYNVKVRYATRKKIAQGEIVDFEIGCGRGR